MKAFWWFKENSIAGMARPGFNSIHWLDLPFDEAVALGWVGRYGSGVAELAAFRDHMRTYVPQIFHFHKLDRESGAKALAVFERPTGLVHVLERLNERTGMFDRLEIQDDKLRFHLSKKRLQFEADFLRRNGIRRLISLTERHHNKPDLENHFELHHIAIEDLNAPRVDQVYVLADIIRSASRQNETIAVHCLAGIGRTSTMLMAAHMALGEDFLGTKERLARQNPRFAFTGAQADFVTSFLQLK